MLQCAIPNQQEVTRGILDRNIPSLDKRRPENLNKAIEDKASHTQDMSKLAVPSALMKQEETIREHKNSFYEDKQLLHLVNEHLKQSIQQISFQQASLQSNQQPEIHETEGDIPEENVIVNSTHHYFQVPHLMSMNKSKFSSLSVEDSYESSLSDLEGINNKNVEDLNDNISKYSSTSDSLLDLDEDNRDTFGSINDEDNNNNITINNNNNVNNNDTKVNSFHFDQYKKIHNESSLNTSEVAEQAAQQNPTKKQTNFQKNYLINPIERETDFNKKFLPKTISEIGRISQSRFTSFDKPQFSPQQSQILCLSSSREESSWGDMTEIEDLIKRTPRLFQTESMANLINFSKKSFSFNGKDSYSLNPKNEIFSFQNNCEKKLHNGSNNNSLQLHQEIQEENTPKKSRQSDPISNPLKSNLILEIQGLQQVTNSSTSPIKNKKSILTTSKHISQFTNLPIVRFDKNIEFCDSNLDLLKKHKQLPNQQENQQQQQQSTLEEKKVIFRGWLYKKSSSRILNSYLKRYFVLTKKKLTYWQDQSCTKELGCFNLKHLECALTLSKKTKDPPTKIHLKLPEMNKILKLKEIMKGDILIWYKYLYHTIRSYANHPKVFLHHESNTKNYKRDIINEKEMKIMARTGDIILWEKQSQSKGGVQIPIQDTALLIKFNENDLRVFAKINEDSPTLFHWGSFVYKSEITKGVRLRRIEIPDRSNILPCVYESIQQQLHENYRSKLKDIPHNHEDEQYVDDISIELHSKKVPQKVPNIITQQQYNNSQIIATIFQKAGIIKQSKKINSFTAYSFCQKKKLKLLQNAKLSNEIEVVLDPQAHISNQQLEYN